jgi:predicted transcriptional regulator
MSCASAEYSQTYDPLKRPIYDWKRKKKLSPSHPKYTMSWLKANAKHFDSLNFLHIVLLTLFWTKRNICHSFKEIAQDCGLADDHAAVLLMKMLESLGLLEIKNQKYKGKYCGRNWYKLTYKGQKLLKAILNKSFRRTPIPTKMLPIEIKKNYPNWIQIKPKKSNVTKSTKDIFKDITKYSLRSDNKKYMLEETAASSLLSFEKREKISREWLIWNPALFDSGAISAKNFVIPRLKTLASSRPARESAEYRRRGALIAEYAFFKTCARRRLFEAFGFVEVYDKQMHIGIWRVLEKEPIKKISKALKLMKKKLSKRKFRMKNFVGFFTHLMNNPDSMGYSAHKAQLYRDALDGKNTPATTRLLSGHDSAEFVALAKEMEEKMGQKVDMKTLSWMLSRGDTQVWLKALQAVKFRGQLDREKSSKTKTEEIFENVPMSCEYSQEVAVRDDNGRLKRDEAGKVIWEEKIFTRQWMERRVVGTREVSVDAHKKAPKEKVKSWIGLWVYAVKLGSVEKIDASFFQKRAETEKPMPRLPGSPPKEDFEYELVDDEPAFGEKKMPMLPPCGVPS